MHPAIQAVSSYAVDNKVEDNMDTSYGIAADSESESFKARSQARREAIPSVPLEPSNVFSSNAGSRNDETRDLEYKSGLAMSLDTNRVLTCEDFKPDMKGSNPALRRMEACSIKRNANYTSDLENWAHDHFIESCKQLFSRPSVELGIVYFGDFIRNFVDRPPSHQLAVQMVLLQQHADSCLARVLRTIKVSEDPSKPSASAWFVDLVGVLELVVEEERTPEARASAAGVIVNKLSLHFAKKACGGNYPSADKLSKTNIYFKRLVVSCLQLADRIGCYDRDLSARPRAIAKARRVLEPSDAEYLFSLETALEGAESDEESEEYF